MNFKSLIFILAATFLLAGIISCGGQVDEFGDLLNEPLETFEAVSLKEPSTSMGSFENATESVLPSREFRQWHLLPTGQTRCYGSTSEIECPKPGEKYYGQDGNYSIGVRSFVDNNDETITDEDTAFIWQKSFKTGVTWYEAKSYCNNLTLSGKSWRLPTPHELRSLINYEEYDPAIDETAFPDTPSDWFWASKHSHFNDASAGEEASWIINFYDGFVEYTSRYNIYNVRCIMIN